MKKIFKLFIVLIMIVSFSIQIIAAENTTRTIVVMKFEGNNVTMTKGTAKTFNIKEGMKLYDGYTVSTGAESYCYLKLDEETVVKLDEKSKISVSKASSTKLSISVLSGALSVNAAPQKDGEVLEVRAGNSALAVRGTIFVVENALNRGASFFMLSGSGIVDGTFLTAGNVLSVGHDRNIGGSEKEMKKIVIDKALSSFLLQTINDNGNELITSGIFNNNDITNTMGIIGDRNDTWRNNNTPQNTSPDANLTGSSNNINAPVTTPAPSTPSPTNPSTTEPASLSTPNPLNPTNPSATEPTSTNTTTPSETYVAEINLKGYTSLEAAIQGAKAGDTINVVANCGIPRDGHLQLTDGVTLSIAASGAEPKPCVNVDGILDIVGNGKINVENNGLLVIGEHGELHVLNSSGMVNVKSGGRVEVKGVFENYGEYRGSGEIKIVVNGQLKNMNILNNHGDFFLMGGLVENYGTIDLNGNFTIDGGELNNKNYFTMMGNLVGNNGDFINSGYFKFIDGNILLRNYFLLKGGSGGATLDISGGSTVTVTITTSNNNFYQNDSASAPLSESVIKGNTYEWKNTVAGGIGGGWIIQS